MTESQIIAWLKTYVYAAPEVQLEMIREMAQRFYRLQARITELEANTAKQEKLLQTHVGLTHSWTVLAAGQARHITELAAQIDRLRQQELGTVDSGDDEDE